MAVKREVKEGIQYQGADETIVYTITTTPWGSTPTSPSADIFENDNGTIGSSLKVTKMTGSASESGDIITLPAIHSLEADKLYRVEIQFTISGNTFEAFFQIKGER